MYFTINIYKYLLGMDDTYRLSKGGKWKKQSDYRKLDKEVDIYFSTYEDAKNELNKIKHLSSNGEIINNNSDVTLNLFPEKFLFEIVVHRIICPKNPYITREQLQHVLLQGDDRVSNTLVVDYEGFPKLIKSSEQERYNYPVIFKPFKSRKGIVGQQHSVALLEGIYSPLIEAWSVHLDTGRNIFTKRKSGFYYEMEKLVHITLNKISNKKELHELE